MLHDSYEKGPGGFFTAVEPHHLGVFQTAPTWTSTEHLYFNLPISTFVLIIVVVDLIYL